jgi:hypothetical protein
MVSLKLFTLVQKGIVAIPIETGWTAAARNPGKPITIACDFSGFKHRPFSATPHIQSIKVSIHTTNAFIEAARIITQMELHIVGVHMKSTKVNLGNNIVGKHREEKRSLHRTLHRTLHHTLSNRNQFRKKTQTHTEIYLKDKNQPKPPQYPRT